MCVTGDASSGGAQASSSGRYNKVSGHRQGAGLEADATAGASGGVSAQKRRLVVKPPKLPEEEQQEDSGTSDAEISDSDESQPRGRASRIKLKVKGSKLSQRQQQTNLAAQSSPAELSQAQKVVKGVLKLKTAAPFSRPVNEEEAPGYGLAVQQPMDLLTVSTKLKDGQYTSLGKRFSRRFPLDPPVIL